MRRDRYEPGTYEDEVTAGPSTESTRSTTEEMQDKASEMTEKTKEQAVQVKDRAIEQAETGKQRAASGLQSAADQLRSRAGEEGTTGQVASKAADTMERSASYLQEHEVNEIWEDFERMVKDHPMQAAAGALFAGFVIGRMMR
ncbi:MAG TPA: hypothetical protein VLA89_00735 [Gemmatimonadales bacterium]|nr:hypothetical protein [Gemmatimonadales bacterium]